VFLLFSLSLFNFIISSIGTIPYPPQATNVVTTPFAIVPTSFTASSKSATWVQAMNDKFDALL
jgi:hypothetical protein